MKNNYSKQRRLLYYILGVVVFVVGVQAISTSVIWTYLKLMPFDHFVNITRFEAENVYVGDQIQKFTIERKAAFDIDARSIKEVYRVDNETPNQIYVIPENKFIYEKDSNGKVLNFELILPRAIEVEAGYYTIDRVCLDLPYNVTKCKVLRTDWLGLADDRETVQFNVEELDKVDRIIINEQ